MKKEFVFNNGVISPALAYGTWLIKNEDAEECVLNAIEVGYRHIDTAQAYGNEEGVGNAIKKCGMPREQLFVTSKIKAEIKDYETAKKSIDESLRKLQLDYIDLMLIHCPTPWSEYGSKYRYFKENLEVWKALTEAYENGKIRSIGVSNFEQEDIDNILNNSDVKPVANQICVHIGHTPIELIKYCQNKNIVIESYSPVAHGNIINNPIIKDLADKYRVSPAQLCIRYTLQLDTISIPKAQNKSHMIENTKLDFEISDEDMKSLLSIQGLTSF